MLFGGRAAVECSEVAALSRLGILFAGIKSKFSRRQLANHVRDDSSLFVSGTQERAERLHRKREPRGSPLVRRVLLEGQAQAELDVTAIERSTVQFVAGRNAVACVDLAGCQQVAVGIGVEVGMVKEVEEFGAELKTRALPGEFEALQDCRIEVPVTRCPESIAGKNRPAGWLK